MQLIKGIIYQTLALIVFISASGFNISVHHCCGKIKEVSFFGEPKGCQMHRDKANDSSQEGTAYTLLAGKSCCYNQQISIQNDSQRPIENVSLRSQSMPVLYLIHSFFSNWFGIHRNIEGKAKPYTIFWYKEPLNILFRQFRL